MRRLKENLKSCGQEPFLTAYKNNSSIPTHTWANNNTVLLETVSKCFVLFFLFFFVCTALSTLEFWVMRSMQKESQ